MSWERVKPFAPLLFLLALVAEVVILFVPHTGTYMVLLDNGNYQVERCYLISRYDCYRVEMVDGVSYEEALEDYQHMSKVDEPPKVVKVVK